MILNYNIENEKEILQVVVSLANSLNRSLVLPTFRCPSSYSVSICNACGNEEFHCHKDVLKKAKLPLKEHVFLCEYSNS